MKKGVILQPLLSVFGKNILIIGKKKYFKQLCSYALIGIGPYKSKLVHGGRGFKSKYFFDLFRLVEGNFSPQTDCCKKEKIGLAQ